MYSDIHGDAQQYTPTYTSPRTTAHTVTTQDSPVTPVTQNGEQLKNYRLSAFTNKFVILFPNNNIIVLILNQLYVEPVMQESVVMQDSVK